MEKIIKIGCCGWAEAQKKYFQDFSVIEIQETFYQLGSLSKYEKWRKEAPKDFEFILKAWQLITHPSNSPTYRRVKEKISNPKNYGNFQPTKEVFEAWERTKEVAKALGSKIILFQCPASFKPEKKNVENFRKFFKKIGNKNFIYLWEPRGKWPEDLVKNLCQELNLIHCVDPFKQKSAYGKINYFRLHGRPGYNLRYRYTDQDLKELLKFCDRKINYILFNNLSMVQDAQEFQNYLSTKSKKPS